MSESRIGPADRARQLRSEFDRTFAAVSVADPVQHENLLMLRLGSESYMVRVSEIAGLFTNRPITGLPGSDPALLGIAAVRGKLVPIYALGLLLGQPRTVASRWFFLLPGSAAGLAFDQFEGHFRLATGVSAVGAAEKNVDPLQRHVLGLTQTEFGPKPVINLASMMNTIQDRARHGGSPKEH